MIEDLRVSAVIVARNEEKDIEKTIRGLQDQTVELNIVLIDDGSTDGTPELAKASGIHTLSLPFHRESYVGNPAIALRFNIGLDYLRRYSPDFVLIMGGDHWIPPDYVESVINQMGGIRSKIVVASGSIRGQPSNTPRGSGRIVNVPFWEGANRMNYPLRQGWESWLVSKALMEGYEVRHFDYPSSVSRETRKGSKKMMGRGRGMYALGYHPYYALARGFWLMLKRPRSGLSMLWGYFNHGGVEKLDVFDFNRERQRKRLFSRIKEKLTGGV